MAFATMRVGAVTLAVLAAIASGCSKAPESAPEPPPGSATASATTTVPEPPPTMRPFCETALPAAWQDAINGGAVNTGGAPTVPLAVGPAGEVVAVRDNGDTRDLLMIGADKSVTEIYPVPEPNRNDVGFAAMDDRWIVIGVDRIPRNSNGVLPGLIQIDVIDRNGGPVRTVTQQSEADYGTGSNAIDSVALFNGKVYWITHDTYAGVTGTVKSFDLGSGAVAQVAEGVASDLRATAAGVTWLVKDDPQQGTYWWQRTEVKVAADLPKPVADAVGTGHDRLSLATDGTAYAWISGLDDGVTGVSWWSPKTGLVRVTGPVVVVKDALPSVFVTGPYVVIGKGRGDGTSGQNTRATVVDTRSGAVTGLRDPVVGVDGGTIAIWLGGYTDAHSAAPSVVRTDALPALTC